MSEPQDSGASHWTRTLLVLSAVLTAPTGLTPLTPGGPAANVSDRLLVLNVLFPLRTPPLCFTRLGLVLRAH